MSQVILMSESLKEAFSELDMTSEVLQITMSPSKPYFRYVDTEIKTVKHTGIFVLIWKTYWPLTCSFLETVHVWELWECSLRLSQRLWHDGALPVHQDANQQVECFSKTCCWVSMFFKSWLMRRTCHMSVCSCRFGSHAGIRCPCWSPPPRLWLCPAKCQWGQTAGASCRCSTWSGTTMDRSALWNITAVPMRRWSDPPPPVKRKSESWHWEQHTGLWTNGERSFQTVTLENLPAFSKTGWKKVVRHSCVCLVICRNSCHCLCM